MKMWQQEAGTVGDSAGREWASWVAEVDLEQYVWRIDSWLTESSWASTMCQAWSQALGYKGD